MVGKVARDQHCSRIRLECPHGLDCGRKPRNGIPAAPVRTDVRITELNEQEGPLHDLRL
jgi:hypothetical protein